MVRAALVVGTVVVLVGSFVSSQEPVKPGLSPRISIGTRQVTVFSTLEKDLLKAVQTKDVGAVRGSLNEGFTLHMPDADAMSAEDWIASVMSKDYVLKSFMVRQVSVADLGDAVVVSYDRVLESEFKGESDGGEFYVVDLWRKIARRWMLSDRYVTKVGDAPYMPKAEVKPSGKN